MRIPNKISGVATILFARDEFPPAVAKKLEGTDDVIVQVNWHVAWENATPSLVMLGATVGYSLKSVNPAWAFEILYHDDEADEFLQNQIWDVKAHMGFVPMWIEEELLRQRGIVELLPASACMLASIKAVTR